MDSNSNRQHYQPDEEDYEDAQNLRESEVLNEEQAQAFMTEAKNRSYNQSYQQEEPEQESFQKTRGEENFRAKMQLETLASKLKSQEDKVQNIKENFDSRDKSHTKQLKNAKTKADELIITIQSNSLTKKANLSTDIQVGIEKRLLDAHVETVKMKKENNELKDVIRHKNEFINTMQEEIRKLKQQLLEKDLELNRLKDNSSHKDFIIDENKKKNDNEYKANALKYNLRQARYQNDNVFKAAAQNVVEKDPYDFWKTSNDYEQPEFPKNADSKLKLANILGQQNNFYINSHEKTINFDAVMDNSVFKKK